MTVITETERLIIREWTDTPGDRERMFDIYSRWEVGRWIGMTEPWSRPDQVDAALARWGAVNTEFANRYGIWAVQVRETGLVAGTVLFKILPTPSEPAPPGTDGDDVEVGWHFHPDSWGHGYATESARAVVARGFEAGLPEVYAIADPANDPSIAVMRRLGMTHVGRTSRWYGRLAECYHLAANPVAQL